jgi:hypothetical protein
VHSRRTRGLWVRANGRRSDALSAKDLAARSPIDLRARVHIGPFRRWRDGPRRNGRTRSCRWNHGRRRIDDDLFLGRRCAATGKKERREQGMVELHPTSVADLAKNRCRSPSEGSLDQNRGLLRGARPSTLER